MTTPVQAPKTASRISGKAVALVVLALLIVIVVFMRRPGKTPAPEPTVAVARTATLKAPPPMPAEPIAMPASPLHEAPKNLLGMLRLRDPHTFPQRLVEFAQAIDPDFSLDELIASISQTGIDPRRCRPGAHAAVFAWKPDQAISAPRFSALVPLPAYDHSMASTLPPHFASFERYTLFGQGHEELEAALAMRQTLQALAQQPLQNGFSAALDLRRIWENYGSVAQLGFQTMQGMIGLGMLRNPALADRPQLAQTASATIGAVAQTLFSALGQSQYLTLGVDLNASQAQITITSQALPDTALARMYAGGPASAPDLLAWLPARAHTVGISQDTVADWTTALEFTGQFIQPLAAALGDHSARQIDDLLSGLPACGATTIASQFFWDSESDQPGAMAGEYLILPENPAAMHALMSRHLQQSFETGFYAQLYNLLGIECELTVEKRTSPSIDGTIRRFNLTLTPRGDIPGPLPPEALDNIPATLFYELALHGPYVLLSIQSDVDGLARHLSTASPETRHQIFEHHAPGAVSVCQIDPAAIIAMIMEVLPTSMQAEADSWPEADLLPPVTMAAYRQQGVQTTQIRVPTRLIASLKGLANQSTAP